MPIEPQIVELDDTSKQRRFVFVLMNNFTMLCFASAIECLRIANRTAGKELYTWKIISEGGEMATCSNGCTFGVDDDLMELDRDDTVMLCGGVDVAEATTKKILNWIRREARRGVAIAGLCTAGYTMARAGLLNGKKATIHWENQDSFTEEFEEVELTKSVFVIDGNRITTAGGTASIDMMLKSRVIQMMEQNIEEPISPAILARDVGMSTRQLERLFRRYLSRSPKRYYMELRLQKARNLLMQTDMTVINVALACGFASPSHFSKCYRSHYNTTPYRERGTQSARLSI